LDNFLATVLVNPWPEERIADSVLRFDGVRSTYSRLVERWNELIDVIDTANPRSEDWPRLGSQYVDLSQETMGLEVEEQLEVVLDK
jgi:hypothetical protein